jgi:hypothetical protein
MMPGRTLDADQFWATEDSIEQEMRRTFPQRPCFGLESWQGPHSIAEWALGQGSARGLQFQAANSHVIISTTDGDPQELVFRMRRNRLPFPTSRNEDLANQTLSTTAPTGKAIITVDAQPAQFDTWQSGTQEWAAARADGFGIAIETSKLPISGLRLTRVVDIEPFIRGRRAELHRARGEV